MSQKATVLKMLRNAGERGVRSDEFIRSYMPRAAARVQDLKDEGVEISSEREGKYVRYRLVGVDAGLGLSSGNAGLAGDKPRASVDSDQLFDITPPSAYDPYSEAA